MSLRRLGIVAAVVAVLGVPGIALALSGVNVFPGFQAQQDQDAQVELGRLLFFERRLSGDTTTSCASCHDPGQGWADGSALSRGYPQTLYFRNAQSVVGASELPWLYWDGRFSGTDMASLVRDHITEAHFMAADGRLVAERLKQVPEYEQLFDEAFGSEPSFGGILNAVSAYLATLQHNDSAYDRFVAGDSGALTAEEQHGMELFNGKAGCASCHSGDTFADGEFYNLGVPTNDDIFSQALRHVSFRRFFRNLGVPNFVNLREDVGLAALTKEDDDTGKFRTAPLRGLTETAPYMHNGVLATLEDVVQFYNEGGGDHPNKDLSLEPLGLTGEEQASLVAFLHSLSGDPVVVEVPELPPYELRPLGDN